MRRLINQTAQLGLVVLFLFVRAEAFAQCDYFGGLTVSTSGHESGAGYTQEFVLVNDGTDEILVVNTTGDFSSTAGGDYRIYAVNYLGSTPSVLTVGGTWSSVNSYETNHCFSIIGPYTGSAITICDEACNGSDIVVSSSGYTGTGSFEQIYALVNSSGTIIATNTSGTFTSTDYGSASGVYSVYAVNTDENTVKNELNDLGAWSDISNLINTNCFDTLGPRYFQVNDAPQATFTIDPNCGGANNTFDINVNVTSLGGAASVNIKDGVPTTHESGVGLGSYDITGYASGSSQTITVENAADPATCPLVQTGLTFSCLTLGACATAPSGTQTFIDEGFEGGSLPTGWSNNYVTDTENWQYVSGGRSGSNPASSYAGSYNACFWKDDFTNDATILSTPVIDFTGYTTNPTLEFYHVQAAWGSDIDTLGVYYKTSAGGTWKSLASYTGAVSSWSQRSITLPNVNSTYYIGFKSTSNYGYGSGVDAVKVTGENPTPPLNVALLNTVGATTAYPQCIDNDWTYYAVDGSSPYLFAINWLEDGSLSTANENARDASNVTLNLGSNYDLVQNLAPGVEMVTYTMKRYWNVNFGSASVALDENVKVRFFYDPAEKTAITNAATSFASTYSAPSYEGFAWFKTVNGDFDPSTNITADQIVGEIALAEDATGTENSVDFVQFAGITSFSGGTGASGASPGGGVLSVELLSFSGEKEGEHNILQWSTATENNSSHFELLRSLDGVEFEKITTLAAQGYASEVTDYLVVDENVKYDYYYKLRSIDQDGSSKTSQIVYLERQKSEWVENNISVYPNPTKGDVTLVLSSDPNELVRLKVYDSIGRIVINEQFQSVQHQFSLENFDQGVYFVTVESESFSTQVVNIVMQ